MTSFRFGASLALFSALQGFGVLAKISNCKDCVVVLEYQPTALVCSGYISLTTNTRTETRCPRIPPLTSGSYLTTTKTRPSGTRPNTSTVRPSTTSTTSTVPPCSTAVTETLSATGTNGTSAMFTAPACARALQFFILGGAGGPVYIGQPVTPGALIQGSIAITGGQVIQAIAGGAGGPVGPNNGGSSLAGNGGDSPTGAGGGGASAIRLTNSQSLVAVAGGGGGTAVQYDGGDPNTHLAVVPNTSTGAAGDDGTSWYSVLQNETEYYLTRYVAFAGGGRAGTATGPGLAGIAGGTSSTTPQNGSVGNDGDGSNGGAGVPPFYVGPGVSTGTGGGGGGYYGGGSGGLLYRSDPGDGTGDQELFGFGGGGSSFVNSTVVNVTQSLAVGPAGSVIAIFS